MIYLAHNKGCVHIEYHDVYCIVLNCFVSIVFAVRID